MDANQDRLFYIDNLRLTMIVLVVIFHVALTYVGYTDWYYSENAPSGYFASAFFSFFLAFNQGYFMGFLFLLAGFEGGLTWQATAYALWESSVCVAMCVGLLGVFRDRFNTQGPFIKTLADNSFAVYVFHTPIVIAIAMWFAPVSLIPIVKFTVVSILCLPACFAFTHYIVRRFSLLKRVM